MLIDDEKNPLAFSEVFHLKQGNNNSYFVTNDMFQLVNS
jgi:hypothetical protein